MIYRITHIDPSYKGTVEPDDLTEVVWPTPPE